MMCSSDVVSLVNALLQLPEKRRHIAPRLNTYFRPYDILRRRVSRVVQPVRPSSGALEMERLEISDRSRTCLRQLHSLVIAAKSSKEHVHLIESADDSLQRYKLWVGSIGAHVDGTASLNHRVRSATRLRVTFDEFLRSLENDTTQCKCYSMLAGGFVKVYL